MKLTDFLKIQENKDHFIDKNDNLDSEQKDKAKEFLKNHPESEKKLDWNKSSSLTWKDFEQIFNDANNTKSAIKKASKENKRLLFENKKNCKIIGENDKFIFVLPLSYKACIWMDSFDCGGAGAKWCIGYEKITKYYKEYFDDHIAFILAFNKFPENIESDLKYMIQINDNNSGRAWTQDDDINNTYEISDSDEKTAQKLTGITTSQLIEFKNEYWKALDERVYNYEYVEITWNNLKRTINKAESSLKIKITDPENVILGSISSTGTLGDIISNYNGEYLLDFTPSDFSTAKYIENNIHLFESCTKLTGMCRLPNNITNASYMFYDCKKLKSIDTSGFTNVTNASYMFYDCKEIENIDTSVFTKVDDTQDMFFGCTKLNNIDTSVFKNVDWALSMFAGCTEITTIDASAFKKVKNAECMFSNCTKLASIDLSYFKNVKNTDNMFYHCTSLDKSSFSFEDLEKFF